MNKNLLISCLAFLIFAVVQISSPVGAATASPQEEQSAEASFLQVRATGLVAYGKHMIAEKTGADASHMVSIPMNSDLNAFFDLVQPQEQTNKKSSLDFRPIFGFHITLR
jgi:hypothetical protein